MSESKRLVIRRQYLDQLIRMKGKKDVIKVITGIRRCGKSTLLAQFRDHLISENTSKENIVSINFESMKYINVRDAGSLFKLFEENISSKGTTYFLLDEIQHVNEWEKAVNSLRIDHDVDIYITGSNSKILSSSLSRDLTGRFFEIPLYPLSLKEFMDLNELSDVEEALELYMKRGSLPVISPDYVEEDVKNMLSGIYSSILFNDIIGMNDVRDPVLLENMSRFLLDNIGNMVTAASISRYTGKDQGMVGRYLKAITGSYLLYKAESFDLKGKRLLKTQAKYYCADIGIRNTIVGEQFGDKGRMIENIVFLELLRNGYQIRVGRYGDKEIDFTAIKNGDTAYFQVTLSLSQEYNLERELESFNGPKDHYRRILITNDRMKRSSQDGVEIMWLGDFLVNGI